MNTNKNLPNNRKKQQKSLKKIQKIIINNISRKLELKLNKSPNCIQINKCKLYTLFIFMLSTD
jgi:hypothetical protein